MDEDTQTLKTMSPGTKGQIAAFREMDKRHVEMLQAMGISPGQWVRVVQNVPVIVVEVGNTELALEHDLAAQVVIEG
jgi:Fe2+ transport system protein FeoA